MFYRNLPAKYESGEHKGEQAYVKITNDKLGRPKTNPIQIEQDKFVFQQFGPEPEKDANGNEVAMTDEQAQQGIQEAIENIGGVTRLLDYINASFQKDAVDSGKAYIRTAESGDVDMVIAAGLKRTAEYSLKSAEKVTTKEIKDVVGSILGNLDSLSNDQIAEMIKKLAK